VSPSGICPVGRGSPAPANSGPFLSQGGAAITGGMHLSHVESGVATIGAMAYRGRQPGLMRNDQNKRWAVRRNSGYSPHSKFYESNGPDVKVRGTASNIAENTSSSLVMHIRPVI
jgi:hypothetical protein